MKKDISYRQSNLRLYTDWHRMCKTCKDEIKSQETTRVSECLKIPCWLQIVQTELLFLGKVIITQSNQGLGLQVVKWTVKLILVGHPHKLKNNNNNNYAKQWLGTNDLALIDRFSWPKSTLCVRSVMYNSLKISISKL